MRIQIVKFQGCKLPVFFSTYWRMYNYVFLSAKLCVTVHQWTLLILFCGFNINHLLPFTFRANHRNLQAFKFEKMGQHHCLTVKPDQLVLNWIEIISQGSSQTSLVLRHQDSLAWALRSRLLRPVLGSKLLRTTFETWAPSDSGPELLRHDPVGLGCSPIWHSPRMLWLTLQLSALFANLIPGVTLAKRISWQSKGYTSCGVCASEGIEGIKHCLGVITVSPCPAV